MSLFSESGGPVGVPYVAPTVTTTHPPVNVTCTPSSSSLFPVGSTTVSCTAADTVGFATCSFRVEVRRPEGQLRVSKFLAFGDSQTEGFLRDPVDYATAFRPLFIVPTLTYPYRLEQMLRQRYGRDDVVVVNEGLGGETVIKGHDRIESALNKTSPDVLLLLHGYNDLLQIPVADAREALRGMVRAAQVRGVEVVLATLFQISDEREASRPGSQAVISELNNRIRGLAASLRLDGVADLELAFEGDPSLMGSDGLHPNPAGYQRVAETFRDEIVRKFEVAPASPGQADVTSARTGSSIRRSGR